MKNKLILIALFTVTISLAQENTKAHQITNELSKVMNLSDDESAQFLNLNIDRFNKRKELEKQYGSDKEGFKEEIKFVEKDFNKKLRKLVGEEKFKLLIEHRKNNKL